MKRLTRVLLCAGPLLFPSLQGCTENEIESDTMPKSAAWRETTTTTVPGSKDVRVFDYVVSNKDWAVTMRSGKGKTVAGKVDGAVFPEGKADSVEAVSPTTTLPFVFSQVKWLMKEGKMYREPHEPSRREPSKGELEKDGDKFMFRYDDTLSFPSEVTIWRKSGEKIVISYAKFRKMAEATSRAEIVRILAPIRK